MSAVVTCSLSVDSPWPAPPSRPRSSARRRPSAAARSRCAPGTRRTSTTVPDDLVQDPHRADASPTAGCSSTRPGRASTPGTFPIEGDLAESWTQPNETTYVFKLRKGVKLAQQAAGERPRADGRRRRVHPSTASSPSRATPTPTCSPSVTRSRRVDKYTVKFTLKEPFVWFLDMLANPMAVAIIAKEVRREVRRPQEARGGDRHRALDARQLPAERRPHASCAIRATSCRACPTSTASR